MHAHVPELLQTRSFDPRCAPGPNRGELIRQRGCNDCHVVSRALIKQLVSELTICQHLSATGMKRWRKRAQRPVLLVRLLRKSRSSIGLAATNEISVNLLMVLGERRQNRGAVHGDARGEVEDNLYV